MSDTPITSAAPTPRKCCATVGGQIHTVECEATWRATRDFPTDPGSAASDERRTAMVLTAAEWTDLAFVAQTFLEDYPNAARSCRDTCQRIVEANK